jgi:hypothetical protein
MKGLIFSKGIRRILDVLLSPLTLVAGAWFRYVRARAITDMPLTKKIFYKTGIFPITDHYYEPLFKTDNLGPWVERHLPGINFRTEEQLQLLASWNFNSEIKAIPFDNPGGLTYYYNNDTYNMGDGEILFSMIRHFKPRKIIEVGCGMSSLQIRNAIQKNDNGCEHICIEPYERPWLEQLNVQIIRKKVEELPLEYFQQLEENDIFFIDSSHMIRPQGDVLFEFLQVLPTLKKGVLVHIHDIYTPKDYPDLWIKDLNRFWNEQYLLEAFLSCNEKFKIVLSPQYMVNNYPNETLAKLPIVSTQKWKVPSSFWLQVQ